MAFDDQHLAFWERVKGETLANLEENPQAWCSTGIRRRAWLAILRHDAGPQGGAMREAIMERTHPFELGQDPERKGYAILIRVDRVRQGNDVIMERDAE